MGRVSKTKQLEQAIALAKAAGAAKLKVDDIEIELPPQGPTPEQVEAAGKMEAELRDLMGGGMPEGEDLMFWSLPGPLPSEVRQWEATLTAPIPDAD